MPRRDRLKVSLFPFMSILACTIGALTFILATMAMTSVGSTRLAAAEESLEAPRPAGAPAPMEGRLEALERERADLERAESLFAELDAALEARGLDSNRSLAEIRAELARGDRSARLEEKLERVDAELASLSEVREGIETSIEVLESRRKTLPILIDPTGLSRSQTPYFIECDGGGVTAYRARDDFEYFVPQDELSTSGDFGRYLRRIRAVPGALLVLLLREDGIDTGQRVESLARDAGIRVAKLPLPGAGALDFRLIRSAEGEG